jgi:nicotinamidase/pyrazinamidase
MRVLFWDVDTQKDFMLPDGKLYIKDAEQINDNLEKLTRFASSRGITVVNTADYHTKDSKEISDTPDFKTTFPKHCMAGEEGQDLIDQTYPKHFVDNYYIIGYSDKEINEDKFKRSRNIIILKDAFDVFVGNLYTNKVLEMLSPDLVVVYGVSGDYCVDYAVRGLLARQYNVVAVYDAIRSIGKTPFEEWVKLGAMVMSTDTTLDFIIGVKKCYEG